MARIIIADDSLVSRTVLGYLVGRAGHIVIAEAKDGAEALSCVVDMQPDLATIDVVMKGSDGLDAIGRIKANYPGVRIVAVADSGQEDELERARRLGVDGILRKPFGLEAVCNLLDELVPVPPPLAPARDNVEIH